MYPNPEMAKKLARERAEAIQQEANQRRLLQEAGLELARPFRTGWPSGSPSWPSVWTLRSF